MKKHLNVHFVRNSMQFINVKHLQKIPFKNVIIGLNRKIFA